jgi:hypothetical protein
MNRVNKRFKAPTSDYFGLGIHRETPKGLKGLKIGKEKPPEGGIK